MVIRDTESLSQELALFVCSNSDKYLIPCQLSSSDSKSSASYFSSDVLADLN